MHSKLTGSHSLPHAARNKTLTIRLKQRAMHSVAYAEFYDGVGLARPKGQRCEAQRAGRGWVFLDGVFCCIPGAFCIRKLCVVQRGIGSVRFLEATWNSNCDSELYQIQLANAQARHCSYTSARKKFVVANGGSESH